MTKRLICLLLSLVMALSLTACGSKENKVEIFAMDTVMNLTAYGAHGADALTAAAQEINRLEELFSRTREGSEITAINNAGGASVTVSDETAELLRAAVTYAEATGGAFDCTVAPLVSAWGITTTTPRVPSQEEINALLPLVGSEHLHLDGNTVTLDAGCSIDLGGIAKGYTSAQVARVFTENGVKSGVISLGGNVYAHGKKENGDDWLVAIQDPAGSGYAVMVSLSDRFAVTSGGYQRNFTAEDGTVYEHILSPATGYPVNGDLTSVTIIGTNGTLCDACSTALYVMGQEGAIAFWQTHSADFEMILINKTGEILYTPGIAQQIKPVEGSAYVTKAIG
jgi:thiamine biosynthesis lipoprotein